MNPSNPDYNLLIAVYAAIVILYFCVQELFVSYVFTKKELEEMNENNQQNQGFKDK
jgi:hypothetical protein